MIGDFFFAFLCHTRSTIFNPKFQIQDTVRTTSLPYKVQIPSFNTRFSWQFFSPLSFWQRYLPPLLSLVIFKTDHFKFQCLYPSLPYAGLTFLCHLFPYSSIPAYIFSQTPNRNTLNTFISLPSLYHHSSNLYNAPRNAYTLLEQDHTHQRTIIHRTHIQTRPQELGREDNVTVPFINTGMMSSYFTVPRGDCSVWKGTGAAYTWELGGERKEGNTVAKSWAENKVELYELNLGGRHRGRQADGRYIGEQSRWWDKSHRYWGIK